jgi:hypothetical protein
MRHLPYCPLNPPTTPAQRAAIEAAMIGHYVPATRKMLSYQEKHYRARNRMAQFDAQPLARRELIREVGNKGYKMKLPKRTLELRDLD